MVVCEASSFQLEDTRGVRARGRGAAQPRRGPPRPPRHLRGLPRGEARGLRPPAARDARGRAGRARARGRRGAARRASRSARRGDAGPRAPRRHAVLARRAADRGAEIRLRGAAQPRERDGGRRGLPRPRRRRRRRSARALATFAGVPHRLEEVATLGGVLYVNDSKATNVASAGSAIRSFAGRRPPDPRRPREGLGLRAARRAGRASAARRVYLIGETAAALHEALARDRRPAPRLRRPRAGRRRARTRPRGPATSCCSRPRCASYDQYRSFEERGDHFRALVAGQRERGCERRAAPKPEGVQAGVEWRFDGPTRSSR